MESKPSQSSGGLQGFLEEHRELSTLVRDARRFSVQIPVVGRIGVPRPRDLAMYGVLGGLAAIGVVEWPAAIGLAIGVTVAERSFGSLHRQPSPARRSGRDLPAATTVTVDGEVLAVRPAPTAKRSARGPSARPFPARRRR